MLDEKDIQKLSEILSTKKDIEDLALMVGKGFAGVDGRFDMIEKRLDRVENILLKQHSEEIENLKKRMSRLEETLAMK